LSLEECIACGFDRILTSGGKSKAIDGVDLIASLNKQANGRIKIMPGSGINENNVQEIVSKTKTNEIHFSASVLRDSNMEFRNHNITGMGSDCGNEFKLRTVSPNRIAEIRRLAVGKR